MSTKQFLGVCDWISDKFGLNVGGVRILFVAAVILGLGYPILLYFVLYLLKPSQY